MGYLEHLESCKRATRVLPPVLNLHPLLKEMAFNLLEVNASTNQISKNLLNRNIMKWLLEIIGLY